MFVALAWLAWGVWWAYSVLLCAWWFLLVPLGALLPRVAAACGAPSPRRDTLSLFALASCLALDGFAQLAFVRTSPMNPFALTLAVSLLVADWAGALCATVFHLLLVFSLFPID